MDADEIFPLTEDNILRLIEHRVYRDQPAQAGGKRRAERWPFPGTVELWLKTDDYEQHMLASCVNLSAQGVGIRCDLPVEAGVLLPIAVHQPEASYHGHAIVRHCTHVRDGYYIGLEFSFTNDD